MFITTNLNFVNNILFTAAKTIDAYKLVAKYIVESVETFKSNKTKQNNQM